MTSASIFLVVCFPVGGLHQRGYMTSAFVFLVVRFPVDLKYMIGLFPTWVQIFPAQCSF